MSTDPDHRLVELRTAHQRLGAEIAELRAWWTWLEEKGQPNFGEMSRRVMHLRDSVMDHFDFEERQGHLDAAARLRPDLAAEVDRLRDDHRRIRQTFGDLAGRLTHGSAAYASWDEPYRRLSEILDELHRHETTEDRVFAAAFGEAASS